MVGSYYYLATRSDWVYTSVYSNMFLRAKSKIMRQNKFDEKYVEELEKYIGDLEFQISLLSGGSLEQQAQDEVSK